MGFLKNIWSQKIPTIYQCDSNGRKKHTMVADMNGTLLVGHNSFPYFAVVAFDVGGIFRLLLLLIATPFAALLYYLVSESKYYFEDVHPETWRVFSSCGRKFVITVTPKVMVEPFLDNLGVDDILGTEISTYNGIATGFVTAPGCVWAKTRLLLLRKLSMMNRCQILDSATKLLIFHLWNSVGIDVKIRMFHGTAIRGHRWFDPFFFYMNPMPAYEIAFLKLSPDQTCSSNKSSQEVANSVQEMIAKTMNYKYTTLTRKHKYHILIGTDGFVEQKYMQPSDNLAYD